MSDKTIPVRVGGATTPAKPRSDASAIDAFVSRARALAPSANAGRLILALDATMSRQPTWDLACSLQGEMFDAVAKAGGLSVQLAYFRGLGEFQASAFVARADALKQLMTAIDCRGGYTQIGKVLAHALPRASAARSAPWSISAMPWRNAPTSLPPRLANSGCVACRCSCSRKGGDGVAERTFKEIARLSKGAWFRFDRNSAATLARLLSAVAVFASGGLKALEARGRPEDRLMIASLRGDKK